MTPLDLVFAAALLTTPPGIPEQTPAPDRWPSIQAALQETALRMEILDPRETSFLASADEFQRDLDILRNRHQELADAPLVADGGRFPDRESVNALLRFNRAYYRNLEGRQVWEPDRADLIGVVMAETDRLYEVWDAVRDARCEFYYITDRRKALQKLRALLGDEAYFAGEMPPFVPIWRFNTR
jgi:hypothetical protein